MITATITTIIINAKPAIVATEAIAGVLLSPFLDSDTAHMYVKKEIKVSISVIVRTTFSLYWQCDCHHCSITITNASVCSNLDNNTQIILELLCHT